MKSLRLRPLLAAGLLAFFVLFLGGCVEFGSQTLTFRYDAAADTMLIYQRYDGIFSGRDKADQLDESEQRSLRTVATEEKTFFFANWILELGVKNLRSASTEPIDQGPNRTAEAVALEREWVKLAGLLADNLRVNSGPFFRDGENRLCGVQRVRIAHFSTVLRQTNVVLRAAAKSSITNQAKPPAEAALFAKFAEPAAEFFVNGTGQIGVRVPDCAKEFETFRSALSEKDAEDFAKFESAFTEAGGRRETRDGFSVWLLGNAGDSRTTVKHGVSAKPYLPNAEAYAQSHFGIAASFDSVADAAEFFDDAPAVPAPKP